MHRRIRIRLFGSSDDAVKRKKFNSGHPSVLSPKPLPTRMFVGGCPDGGIYRLRLHSRLGQTDRQTDSFLSRVWVTSRLQPQRVWMAYGAPTEHQPGTTPRRSFLKISGSVTCSEMLLRPDGYIQTSIEKRAVPQNTL